VGTGQLKVVYPPTNTLVPVPDGTDTLDPGDSLPKKKTTGKKPLIVKAPTSAPQQDSELRLPRYFRFLVFNVRVRNWKCFFLSAHVCIIFFWLFQGKRLRRDDSADILASKRLKPS
jgi:hypothetical protein